ncbi:MAG TPA: tRNA (N(6)-L-threonylcarbamoyladenosine(37)-C(2))-methylthiotransferase MtaB, partial [Armatimonadetes bacterium]|nr:tRNA (N(6)-L-threonylcarbamoyladenosine(37)-C(2))-methylthiotransferase MtaB [Armatimonadota bacterium]
REGSRYEPLRALVEELAALDGLARLRLGSILPIDANPGLFTTLAASPRGCPHLHLPLQSGDDDVLQRMDRRYDTARFRRVVDEARAALGNPALASDVMVGFPGETTAAFDRTLAFCAEIGFADLHIFAYSPRPGTRAARWPDDVPPAEKAARARALADLRDSLWREYHSHKLQTEAEVLIEQSDPEQAEVVGLSADYLRVRAKVDRARPGREVGALVRVRLESLDGEAGYGQVVANT